MEEKSLRDLEDELARLLLRQERDKRKLNRINSSQITIRGAKAEMSMRSPQIQKLRERIAKMKNETPT